MIYLCAIFEVVFSAVLTVLLSEPKFSFEIYSCGVSSLSDFYTYFVSYPMFKFSSFFFYLILSSVQPNAELWENSDLYTRTSLSTSDYGPHLLFLVCHFYANFTTVCDEEPDKWEDIALLCTLCISTSGIDLRCGWRLHLFLISIHKYYHKLCGKCRSFCDEARHGYETIVGFVV